jgi:hypothetical protein
VEGVTDEKQQDEGAAPEPPATEGDRAWRERMQETGEQARRLQPPVPEHPESAPTPNP